MENFRLILSISGRSSQRFWMRLNLVAAQIVRCFRMEIISCELGKTDPALLKQCDRILVN